MRPVYAVAKPHAQIDLAVGECVGGNRLRHVHDGDVAKIDGENATRNRERHRGRRFIATGAGAVVAPISGVSSSVDQRKFELTGASVVGAIDSDFALVADDAGYLGDGGEGCEGDDEQGEGRQFCFHNLNGNFERRLVVRDRFWRF